MKIYSILMADYASSKIQSNITADFETADTVLRAYISEYIPAEDIPDTYTGAVLISWFYDMAPELPVMIEMGVYDTELTGNHELMFDPLSVPCDEPDCELCKVLDPTGLRFAEVTASVQ